MAQPGRLGASSPAQNGAVSAAGPPYSNGPVQNPLMHSQVSVSQEYSSPFPGSYLHQIPAKTPLNPTSGPYNYGGTQTVSSLNSYQGPGQTLNRLPLEPNPVTPLQSTIPVPQMPPPPSSQTPAAVPASSNSFLCGPEPSPSSNWQYGHPSMGSKTNNFVPVSTQPSLSGNTNLSRNNQNVSFGAPSFQNNYMKTGSIPPPTNQPLPTIYQPTRAPLGPPPSGGPPPVRSLDPQRKTPNSVPSQPQLNSTVNQKGDTSTASNGSMVENSYDTIEGGGFMAAPQLTNQNPKVNRNVGYSYPSLPPGYQNTSPPTMSGRPSTALQYTSGLQPFSQSPLGANHLTTSMGGLSLHSEGLRVINLLQERNMLPTTPLKAPVPNLHEDIQKLNCNPE